MDNFYRCENGMDQILYSEDEDYRLVRDIEFAAAMAGTRGNKMADDKTEAISLACAEKSIEASAIQKAAKAIEE